MKQGQIVISKQGRDKGLPFVVVAIEGEFLYLADGKLRKIQNPKKKRPKHIQATNYIDVQLQDALIAGKTDIKDSDLRTILRKFFEPRLKTVAKKSN